VGGAVDRLGGNASPPKWKQSYNIQSALNGTYPVLGEQFLALAKEGNLAIGDLTVHCPDKGCKYHAGDYGQGQGNELKR
jgi:hypothetical protein